MQETSAETETVAVPKALLEKLLDRVDELEEQLKEYQDHNERDKAQIRQQVSSAVESERSESEEESEQEEMLPMERLIQLGETGVTATVYSRSVFGKSKYPLKRRPVFHRGFNDISRIHSRVGFKSFIDIISCV